MDLDRPIDEISPLNPLRISIKIQKINRDSKLLR